VRGDEVVGVKLGERIAGGSDNRLEQRIAGPSSSNKMSVTLSTSVVIVSDSTGSRPIVSNSLMTGTFLSRSTPANNTGQATPG
jgi:hypothetical protein